MNIESSFWIWCDGANYVIYDRTQMWGQELMDLFQIGSKELWRQDPWGDRLISPTQSVNIFGGISFYTKEPYIG